MADGRLLSDDKAEVLVGLLLADRAARQERERADVDLMGRLNAICANLEFAGHDKRCPTQRTEGAACTCGRDDTLAALRARLEQPHA